MTKPLLYFGFKQAVRDLTKSLWRVSQQPSYEGIPLIETGFRDVLGEHVINSQEKNNTKKNGYKMKIPNHIYTVFLILYAVIPGMAIGQSPVEEQLVTVEIKKLALGATATCELVQNGSPINKAAVFSSTLKKVYCYTNFTSVPERVFTYHNWYLRDRLKASIKLVLRPTRWSTYSAMELRSSDRGPWRVEVTDEEGNVLETLRFSIIE